MRNWYEMGVPHEIAFRQEAWERRHAALRMWDVGMTLREIGKRSGGVSRERARQLVNRAQADNRQSGYSCPVSYWMEAGGEIAELAQRLAGKYWSGSGWIKRKSEDA